MRSLGYSTPRVYAHIVADGLALIEDFGSETIVDANGVNPSRYAEAAALLADMHMRALPRDLCSRAKSTRLPVYDLDAMLIEVELALDWYAPAIARGAPSSGARMQFLGLWREILSPPLAGPLTWTLRDYHSPNLHWLAERNGLARLGLIDFQDAVLGPPAYDVASLLQDARQSVPGDVEARLLALYGRRRGQADPSFDFETFVAHYAIMGAQRATKILGLFIRLDRRDGKPQYLQAAAAHRADARAQPRASDAGAAAALVRDPSAARARRPAGGLRLGAESRDGVRRRSRHAHAAADADDSETAHRSRRQAR